VALPIRPYAFIIPPYLDNHRLSTVGGGGAGASTAQGPSPSCRFAMPGHASCRGFKVGRAKARDVKAMIAMKNRIVTEFWC